MLLERESGGLMERELKGSPSSSEPAVGGMVKESRPVSDVKDVPSSCMSRSEGEGDMGFECCSRVSGNSSSKRLIMPLRVLSRKRRRSMRKLVYAAM